MTERWKKHPMKSEDSARKSGSDLFRCDKENLASAEQCESGCLSCPYTRECKRWRFWSTTHAFCVCGRIEATSSTWSLELDIDGKVEATCLGATSAGDSGAQHMLFVFVEESKRPRAPGRWS